MRWLIVLVLLSSFVLAQSTIVASPVVNQVNLGQQASYELKITNHASVSQDYIIYSLSTKGWTVDPAPLRDKTFSLSPGATKKVVMNINAFEDFSPGIYFVPVTIETDQGERHNENLKIYLAPESNPDYLPVIRVTVDMDEKINPKETLSIKLFLENRNPLDLNDLIVKIQSDMPEFAKEVPVNLPPLEKKTVEFTITPNRYQQPKDYTLFFVFEKDGQTAKVVEQKVQILPLLPDFEIVSGTEDVFFKRFTSLTVTNPGNVKNTQQVTFPLSFWAGLVTQDAQVLSGERAALWEMELGPNEAKTVHFVVNYRLYFYALALLVLIIGFYFSVKSPIVVTKKAVTPGKADDGSVSEVKVTLEVRNKTNKVLQHVDIIDLVPGIANVEKSLELGTLKPQHITHTKKGTKVQWSLAELDGKEHRLVTYKVKAKLNILGTLILPRASVSWKKGKRSKKAFSNIYRLGG